MIERVAGITSSIKPGAGAIALALHRGLLAEGIDSTLFIGEPTSTEPRSVAIGKRTAFERLLGRITRRAGWGDLHCRETWQLGSHPALAQAQVIHCHNLHGGFFDLRALPRLAAQRPVVITLHDMWAVTGHCSYSLDCERWVNGCGSCPYLSIYPALTRDTTAWHWRMKENVFKQLDLTLVTPSRWLAGVAAKGLLGHCRVETIPNGIDTNEYAPLDRAMCRQALGIPMTAHMLLFTAADFENPLKGGQLLQAALRALPVDARANLLLLVMGRSVDASWNDLPIPVRQLGFLSNARLKSLAFGAADLFLCPSRADNAPIVLQEALACGTPQVGFNVGGVPELIRNGETGLVAQRENAADFARCIMQLLADADLRRRMSLAARHVAEAEFSPALFLKRHLALYESLAFDRSAPSARQMAIK